MSNFKAISYTVINRVATIVLDRPRQLNALSLELCREVLQALKAAGLDEQVRVIIITSNGHAFCSGADLAEGQNPKPGVIEEQINTVFGPVFTHIYDMEKPVICALNGLVAGGGCAFPLVCDFTIMSEDAFLYLAFPAIGLVPDCGVSWLLEKQLGVKRSYQIIIENEKMPASRCLELGLVNKVVAQGDLLSEANSWAQRIVSHARLVPIKLKQLLRDVPQMSYANAVSYEGAIQDELVQTEESRQRINKFLKS